MRIETFIQFVTTNAMYWLISCGIMVIKSWKLEVGSWSFVPIVIGIAQDEYEDGSTIYEVRSKTYLIILQAGVRVSRL
jgi:hypothetical protein